MKGIGGERNQMTADGKERQRQQERGPGNLELEKEDWTEGEGTGRDPKAGRSHEGKIRISELVRA